MIDEGAPQLGTLRAVGNFWHGYYSTTAGWRSRAGAVMPGFTPNALATGRLDINQPDAHLLDFGMPAVETPEHEAALGMERWNKAVLHGSEKYYSILSAKNFGAGGWPYRAPDGTTFFLQADTVAASGIYTLRIKAGRLTTAFTAPATIVATITLPASGGVDTVNFSPDGSRAAIHSYDSEYLGSTQHNTVVRWIFDATVSGGSAEALPSVTLAAIPEQPTNVDGDVNPEVPDYKVRWVLDHTVYTDVTASERVAHGHYRPELYYTSTRPLYSAYSYYDRPVMIVFAPGGTRHCLRAGYDLTRRNDPYTLGAWSEEIIAVNQQLVGSEWIANGAPWYEQIGSANLDQVSVLSWRARLSRDFTPISVIEAGQTETTVSGVITTEKFGNGWKGNEKCVLNPSVPFKFWRVASNVLTMLIDENPWQLLGWGAAHGAGTWSYAAPQLLTDKKMPSIHPETGAFSVAIRLYF